MFMVSSRQKTADVLGSVCDWYCYDCCKNTKWEMGQVTKWLSIFNLRTLPFKKIYRLICSSCCDQLDLSHREYRNIRQILRVSRNIKGTRVHQQLTHRIVIQQLTGKNTCQYSDITH